MTDTVEAGAPQRECDLVMKGGSTSCVVRPTAIRRIAAEYRFRNLGGASPGDRGSRGLCLRVPA
jgi:hypothetical protein